MSDSNLKKTTTSSLFWSIIDKFGQQIVYLVSTVVLMNIIDASEYGIIGVLTIFIALSSLLIDSGFGRALLNKRDVSHLEYSSVFYFNLFLSIVLYIIFFFLAPLLAELFHNQKITSVSRVLFLSLIFNAIGLIQQTIITKKSDFKGLTKINVLALILSVFMSIYLAINGYGVWALVAQTVVQSIFRNIFLWFYSQWIPLLSFSFSVLKSFFALSNKLLLTGVINSLFNNIYPSIIAFFYPNSMNQVGYFTQANKYQEMPFGVINNSFRSVAMLVLSEINDQSERMYRVFSKMLTSISFLVFPIGFFMIIAAEPVFHLLFGTKWDLAIPYFQILTLGGIVSPYISIFNELYIASNRGDYFLGIEIAKRLILVVLIIFFLPYGIKGLAISWVVYSYITLIISLFFSKKLVRYSALDFIKNSFPYAFLALISMAVALFFTSQIYNNALNLLISGAIILSTYIILCKILKLEMIDELSEWMLSKLKKN